MRRFIHNDFRITAIHNKVDGHAGIHNSNKQATYSTRETAFQPVTRVCVANSDGQGAILIGNRFGVAHPGIEGGAWHFHLELSEY
jgi:hypothetical protein